MKLNYELFREIAEYVENHDIHDQLFSSDIELEGRTADEIAYHVELMAEEKLLKCSADDDLNSTFTEFFIDRLTLKGHEFLAAARNDTLWNKAITQVRGAASGISFAVFSEMLKKAAAENFHL